MATELQRRLALVGAVLAGLVGVALLLGSAAAVQAQTPTPTPTGTPECDECVWCGGIPEVEGPCIAGCFAYADGRVNMAASYMSATVPLSPTWHVRACSGSATVEHGIGNYWQAGGGYINCPGSAEDDQPAAVAFDVTCNGGCNDFKRMRDETLPHNWWIDTSDNVRWVNCRCVGTSACTTYFPECSWYSSSSTLDPSRDVGIDVWAGFELGWSCASETTCTADNFRVALYGVPPITTTPCTIRQTLVFSTNDGIVGEVLSGSVDLDPTGLWPFTGDPLRYVYNEPRESLTLTYELQPTGGVTTEVWYTQWSITDTDIKCNLVNHDFEDELTGWTTSGNVAHVPLIPAAWLQTSGGRVEQWTPPLFGLYRLRVRASPGPDTEGAARFHIDLGSSAGTVQQSYIIDLVGGTVQEFYIPDDLLTDGWGGYPSIVLDGEQLKVALYTVAAEGSDVIVHDVCVVGSEYQDNPDYCYFLNYHFNQPSLQPWSVFNYQEYTYRPNYYSTLLDGILDLDGTVAQGLRLYGGDEEDQAYTATIKFRYLNGGTVSANWSGVINESWSQPTPGGVWTWSIPFSVPAGEVREGAFTISTDELVSIDQVCITPGGDGSFPKQGDDDDPDYIPEPDCGDFPVWEDFDIWDVEHWLKWIGDVLNWLQCMVVLYIVKAINELLNVIDTIVNLIDLVDDLGYFIGLWFRELGGMLASIWINGLIGNVLTALADWFNWLTSLAIITDVLGPAVQTVVTIISIIRAAVAYSGEAVSLINVTWGGFTVAINSDDVADLYLSGTAIWAGLEFFDEVVSPTPLALVNLVLLGVMALNLLPWTMKQIGKAVGDMFK